VRGFGLASARNDAQGRKVGAEHWVGRVRHGVGAYQRLLNRPTTVGLREVSAVREPIPKDVAARFGGQTCRGRLTWRTTRTETCRDGDGTDDDDSQDECDRSPHAAQSRWSKFGACKDSVRVSGVGVSPARALGNDAPSGACDATALAVQSHQQWTADLALSYPKARLAAGLRCPWTSRAGIERWRPENALRECPGMSPGSGTRGDVVHVPLMG
jgi:hypothetical protein